MAFGPIVSRYLRGFGEEANADESDLIGLHFGLGTWIRNNLGIWRGNNPLTQAIRGNDSSIHPGEDGNGERRLNLWVSTRTDLAIERLARRYCVTKREIVERLVSAMDDRIIATLDIDAPEWDQYFTAASVTQ